MSDFTEMIGEWLRDAKESEPHCSISVCRDGQCISVILDTSASYFLEWIPGEGGDVGLLRCRNTGRVVGVDLPLLQQQVTISGLSDKDVVTRDEVGGP